MSVIIPAFNAERYLQQAVESVVRERGLQSAGIEIILVEDGSTDGTLAVCERMRDAYPDAVRLLRHPGGVNRGPGPSRNLGLELSRGEIICFLDADDYWLPGRLDVGLDILRRRPEVDGVYEPVEILFEESAIGDKPHFRDYTPMLPPGLTSDQIFESVLCGRTWHTDGILLRRGAFKRSGVFHDALRIGEDLHLWIRLAAFCNLVEGRRDTPVAVYRRHGANTFDPRCRDNFEFLWEVCRWFHAEAGRGSKARLVLMRLIQSALRRQGESAATELALMVRRAARIAWAFPQAFGCRGYYKLLRQILTLRPLRRRMSGRRRRSAPPAPR